jgi:hypothetical protein
MILAQIGVILLLRSKRRDGPDSDTIASVADQFETDITTPGNGSVKNKSFVLRRFAEAVRPKCYGGLAEWARRQRPTT